MRWVLSIGLSLAATGCGGTSEPLPSICAGYAAAGISVRVKDSSTGTWAASGATLLLKSGAGDDSASFPANRPDLDSLSLAGAWELPGSFEVTVRKAGYQEWKKADVVVTSDVCHVRPVLLTALLQPI